jgi:hypothetical protein
MQKDKFELKVAEKIEAVLALHKIESPGVPLTVSSLARKAGVSRANLYISHPDVVESLNQFKQTGPCHDEQRSSTQKLKKMKAELDALKRTNGALLIMNGALRGRIRELERRLADMAARPRGRKGDRSHV